MSMRPMYRDRNGQPMDLDEWGRAFERTAERIIGKTELPNGVVISTVWLGLDHNWGDGPPHIFESMAFLPSGEGDDCERYSTEEEARAGHETMVEKWRSFAAEVTEEPGE